MDEIINKISKLQNIKIPGRIYGTIQDVRGMGITGLLVVAYDLDMRTHEELGFDNTNKNGEFNIKYKHGETPNEVERNVNIRIRVYSRDKKIMYFETPIDQVVFDANIEERFDIVLDKKLESSEIEYLKVKNAVEECLQRVEIHELQENQEHQDLTYIAKETGVSIKNIELFVIAYKITNFLTKEKTDLSPELFYALLRQNTFLKVTRYGVISGRMYIDLNSDIQMLVDDLSLVDQKIILEDINVAEKKQIVEKISEKDLSILKKYLKSISETANERYQKEVPEKIIGILSDFVVDSKFEILKNTISKSNNDFRKLSENLSDGSLFKSKKNLKNAKLNLVLGELIGFESDIIKNVKTKLKIDSVEKVSNLARMNKTDWVKMIEKSPGLVGDSKSDKKIISLHSSILVRKFEKNYPTIAFAAQVEREKKVVFTNQKEIKEVYKKFPNLDLQNENLDLLFTKTRGITKNKNVLSELKSIQRVFKLVPNYTKSMGLISKGVNSASSIVNIGRSRFMNEIAPSVGLTKNEAMEVYKKAESKSTAAMLIAGDLQYTSDSTAVAYDMSKMSLKMKKISDDFPNLVTLFKGIDSYDCDHCRSVYSPSAYFVELLEFLDKRTVVDLTVTPNVTTNIAKDVLFEKRPDIGEIDLSCENSNTPIPYIDLVCETLEDKISPDLGINYTGNLAAGSDPNLGKIHPDLLSLLLTQKIPITENATIHYTESIAPSTTLPHYIRDSKAVLKAVHISGNKYKIYRLKQTLSDEKSLLAAPEYVNEKAYNILKTSKFAFVLPFDLRHLETLTYLERFDMKWDSIKEVFTLPVDSSTLNLASAYFNFSEIETEIIVKQDLINQNSYWNTTVAVDEMKIVNTFLNKTGLTYKELEILLSLKSMKLFGNLFIKHLDLTPDTTKKEIANLNSKSLDLIHRFLRLWKKVKISFSDLDELIMQLKFGNEELNEVTLGNFYLLKKIAENSGIKFEELLGCFGTIPHSDSEKVKTKSLYTQIFLNKAKNGFIDEALLPEKIDGSNTLEAVKNTLSICLQTPLGEIETIKSRFVDDDLTFENLSKLLFSTRIIRKFKIKAEDFNSILDLTGISPANSVSDAFDFINYLSRLKSMPLKAQDIKYIIAHDAINLADRELKNEVIESLLTTIQLEFQELYSNTKSKFSSDLKAAEQLGELNQLLLTLPETTEEIAKNIVEFVDKKYSSVTDAKNFIDDNLLIFFDTTLINAALDLIDAATDVTLPDAQNSYVSELMKSISEFSFLSGKNEKLVEMLSSQFKSEPDLIEILLENVVNIQGSGNLIFDDLLSDTIIDKVNEIPAPPAISEVTLLDQYDALRLLHKVVPFIASLNIEPNRIEYLLNNSTNLSWLEIDSIPYKSGQVALNLNLYLEIVEILSIAKDLDPVPNPADISEIISFESILDQILLNSPRDEFIANLSLLLNYENAQVDSADKYFNSPFDINFYKEIKNWQLLLKALQQMTKLSLDASGMKNLLKKTLTEIEATELQIALKSRYDEETWNSTQVQISNKLRPKKRDALVGYILATNPDIKDTNYLYDELLIDTQMESDIMSSRIVIAHNVVQLFVQRCLMGLEPKSAAQVDLDSGWEQWVWMKNYRVWEANRKVFLYPENWIEPELRDDKSYLFKELEDELLQNELTDYNIENSFTKYLEKLDEIAFLEIVATWYEEENYTMHVFGRTKGGDPSNYYYRRLENERVWSAWEKVDLEISGNHVLAFKRNNRLCLAWPMFSDEADPNAESTMPNQTPGTKIANDKPKKKLKIQIAVSELANGIWQPKKVSVDAILTPSSYTTETIDVSNYNLMYFESTSQILLFTTKYSYGSETQELNGIFNVTGCKGYPELAFQGNAYFPDFYPDFQDASLISQRYKELNKDTMDNLAVRNAISLFNYYDLLMTTPANFRITYPLQFTKIDLVALLFQYFMMSAYSSAATLDNRKRFKLPLGTLLPYFDEDSLRSYVIIPGFYSREKRDSSHEEDLNSSESEVQIQRTASDTLKLIEAVINLFNKYKAIYEADPSQDLSVLFSNLASDDDYIEIVEEIKVYLTLRYGEKFKNNYHPLVCSLRKTLYKDGIGALMKRETQLQVTNFNFENSYNPTSLVPKNRPVEDIDFTSEGSYSIYNWELFYHVPSLLANRLTSDQKFEQALKWYHYIFNPTGALSGDVPQKFWVTKPFYLTHESDYLNQRIDNLLYKIADPNTPERAELEFAIDEWRENPFKPHVVARFRPVAYQKAIVMKYIDNLIEWGDFLFTQDTMESIVQATQMYILADKLLGEKPRVIPNPIEMPNETYNQIKNSLDAFGNAIIDIENILPDLSVLPEGGAELPPMPTTLGSLYFCVPKNDKILQVYDKVADRLFKIRNSQNIDGVYRSLALFSPPIDPAMLVKAAASGMDLSSIISGLNSPSPFYRFNLLVEYAVDFASEVRYLGSQLLSALEKKDAESLTQLRSVLEMKILNAQKNTKLIQINEANEQIITLQRSKQITEERLKYYSAIEKISSYEQLNMDKLDQAVGWQVASTATYALGAALALIPDFQLGVSGFGGSPHGSARFGGSLLAHSTDAIGKGLSIGSTIASFDATRAASLGQYDRRYNDWKLQERLAQKEIDQIDQQIKVAEIRLKIVNSDYKTSELQIENLKKTDEFMKSKFTNKSLYSWMVSQTSSLYFRTYKQAYEMSLKAQKSYQFELGNNDTFIDFGYWDSMKKGLLSADKLIYDLKKMQSSYIAKNKREYEITKSISLAKLDPLALIRLKKTGSTDFEIPESIYNLDHSSHYFRRIKTVSVSLPCIVGPYTSVSCKLSQVSNKYRKVTSKAQGATNSKEEYEEVLNEDERFVYNVGTIQSIATSNSQNDDGLFELNFNDSRYLPFEGTGAISSWRLELPKFEQFDYDGISDVILNISYTAREGGSTLKNISEESLFEKLSEIKQDLSEVGTHHSINMKTDMPREWNLLKRNGTVEIKIPKNRLPYFVQSFPTTMDKLILLSVVEANPSSFQIGVNGVDSNQSRIDELMVCKSEVMGLDFENTITLSLSESNLALLEDLNLIIKYTA